MSFIDDIKGQNTQLFPIVEIDGIWYSTNNVTIKDFVLAGLDSETISRYCKPILMNIPSTKESVDIESRKVKISSVSLEFNNFPFDGVRFSDQLSESSLINTEATIYFKSPSTEYIHDMYEAYKGIIRRITHDDSSVKVELEDLTEKLAHKDLPKPENYLGSGEDVPDKYKNKPIPMVYGHVDRSPVVISENFRKFQADSKLIKSFEEAEAGYTDVDGHIISLDSLQVDVGDGEVFHIQQEGQYEEPALGDNYINLLETVLSGIVIGGADEVDSLEDVSLICRKIANPKFTITSPRHDTSLVNDDFLTADGGTIDNINAISDGSLDANPITLEGLRPSSGDNSESGGTGWGVGSAFNNERLLLSLNFDVTPSHDTIDGVNKIIGFRINGYNLPKYLGDVFIKINHFNGVNGSGDITSISSTYHNNYKLLYDTSIPHYTEINKVFGFLPPIEASVDGSPPSSYDGSTSEIKIRYFVGEEDNMENSGMYMPVILFSGALVDGGVNNTFFIQFRVVGSLVFPDGDWVHSPHVELDGNIDEIGLLIENQSIKLFNNDFYANVKGRINIYPDHPDESLIAQYTSTYPYLSEVEMIENPIDIIYDLVRSELGHEDIDEAEYLEAKAAHDGWKFGFSQLKKINSKKLIEEIAKSTKCFPKFKNDGTFGFNTIKDSYTVAEYESDTTTLIKESEVISYSFKKTKPEQIYKRVDVQYHKDYAQDSYKRTDTIITGTYTGEDNEGNEIFEDAYYGIADSRDTYLEFESDYIRHDSTTGAEQTADKLAAFLAGQYKNDHLLFNLKLPLQYINLEIGDLVKFRDLFQGVKAYGIDYRHLEAPNAQYYYPLFMVTSTTKNLSSVSIECMQLHHLAGDIDGFPSIGESGGTGWFEGIGVDDTEGLFYFPDSEAITIIPPPVEEEIVVAESVYTDSAYIDVTPDNPLVAAGNFVINLENGGLSSNENSFESGDFPYNFSDFPSEFFAEGFFVADSTIKIARYGDEDVLFTFFRVIEVLNNNELVVQHGEGMNVTDWWVESASNNFEALDIVINRVEVTDAFGLGDVNQDGQVNILDVVNLVNHVLGVSPITEQQQILADFNQDGQANILDIVQITNHIMDN